jgi:hypothetical protein
MISKLAGLGSAQCQHLLATMMNFTRFPGGLVVNAAISGIEHALGTLPEGCGTPSLYICSEASAAKIRVTKLVATAIQCGRRHKRIGRSTATAVKSRRIHRGERDAYNA